LRRGLAADGEHTRRRAAAQIADQRQRCAVKRRAPPGLKRDGKALLARRAPDEQRREALIAARRGGCRPELVVDSLRRDEDARGAMRSHVGADMLAVGDDGRAVAVDAAHQR